MTSILRLIVFSLIGLFTFFIPITINGKSSIPLDHMVTWVQTTFPTLVPYYALMVILLGAIYPFYKKTWNKDSVTKVFSLLKVVGLICCRDVNDGRRTSCFI